MAQTASPTSSPHENLTTRTDILESSDKQRRERIDDNFIVFWVTTNVPDLKSMQELRQIINSVHVFDNADECINRLIDIHEEKIFFIVSEPLCGEVIAPIHQRSQIKYIYLLSLENQETKENWSEQYRKIRGIYHDISSIFAQMRQDVRQYSDSSISMSVFASNIATNPNNNEQEALFMYSRLLREIFINMETTEDETHDSKIELCQFLHEQYYENTANLAIIEEFERDYSSSRAIWWYTRECFLYRLLNKALRIQDTEVLYKFRFFIKDLHLQIQNLNSKTQYDSSTITVYRGQGMSNDDFQRLQQNIGGLLSIHSFWSTSLDPQISSLLVPFNDPDTQGILFQVLIDTEAKDIAPFANIQSLSHFQTEKEVLFSMGSVFRILRISKNTDDTWVVSIKPTNEEDSQLKALREHMTEQINGTKMGEYNLAKLLRLMGKYDEQERFYQIMLSDISLFDDMPRVLAIIYNDLAGIFKHRRDFTKALDYYHKSLEIDEKHLPPNNQTFAKLYNNIGSVYSNQDDLDQALIFLGKSLKISLDNPQQDRHQIAATYNNIAEVHRKNGDHENALRYHKMALDMENSSLPLNHPTFSVTYSNMGGSHYQQGNYEEALNYFQKALNIKYQSLPPNHPSFSITYGNIALALHKLGRKEEAFNTMVKAIEIASDSLTPGHPHLEDLQDDFQMICESL